MPGHLIGQLDEKYEIINYQEIILFEAQIGTHQTYGWQAVLNIILITEVLALSIAYFNNCKYKNFNQGLETKKESIKGRE